MWCSGRGTGERESWVQTWELVPPPAWCLSSDSRWQFLSQHLLGLKKLLRHSGEWLIMIFATLFKNPSEGPPILGKNALTFLLSSLVRFWGPWICKLRTVLFQILTPRWPRLVSLEARHLKSYEVAIGQTKNVLTQGLWTSGLGFSWGFWIVCLWVGLFFWGKDIQLLSYSQRGSTKG